MARKTRKAEKPTRRRVDEPLPKPPFSICDRGAYINRPWVACAPIGKTHLAAIYYRFSTSTVEVAAVGIDEIGGDWQSGRQFYLDGTFTMNGPEGIGQTHLQWLKNRALQTGATPDAIRYMGQAIKLTKQEEAIMAEKLKRGGAKAAKETKTKPVGGGGKVAGKKGGNNEALAKAREASAARTAESHAKKITVKVTAKDMKAEDFKLRGGRLEKLSKIVADKPKTVGDAIAIGEFKGSDGETYKIDMGALRGMEKRGHITIG